MIPNREQAYELLLKYNQTQSLIVHAKTVEGVMRYFAGLYGEDPELWGAVGLLHDLDYEKYPEEHCKKCLALMKEAGIDEDFARSCASHGYGICTDIEPTSNMEKVLFAIDELTGLIHAAAIMRPSKSVMDLELKSVKKKYKTRSFAAGVDRDLIERGASNLGLTLDELITRTIDGMRTVAADIGLAGNAEDLT